MGKPNYEYVKAGVGYSILSYPHEPEESFSAGQRAAQMALEFMKHRYGLEEVEHLTMSLVFLSTKDHHDKILEGIKSILEPITKDCPLIGCTTAGEITSQGVHDNSVSVFLLSSELIAVGVGVGEGIGNGPKEAGENAALNALNRLEGPINTREALVLRVNQIVNPVRMIGFYPYLILMFPPGMDTADGGIFYTPDDYLIEGLREAAGPYAPIVGGSSGDGRRTRNPYQFCNGQISSRAVVCGILACFVKTGLAMEQLFIPSENSLLVNKVNTEYPPSLSYEVNRGFEIQQLDGKPAAEKYFEILKGKIPEESYDKWIDRIKNKLIPVTEPEREHPFGLTDLSGRMWARVPTFVREDGTIEFSSLIPENKTLTQMKLCAVSKANSKKDLFRETTINAVESAIQNANVSKGEVAAVLVFICCSRRWMGEEHLFDITLDFNTKDRWEKKQAIVNLPTYNKLKDALKNNTISDVLRKIFEEGGYSLSTEAVIYRVDDNEWKIWDGKDEYIIMALKEPEEKLEVYQGIGELDLDAIKDVVGDDVPIIGFYTYGEQMSSLRGPGRLEISCTVMIISQVVVNQTFKVTFRDEKIKTVVAEVESESRSLSKRDLLRELKDYFEVRPEKIKDIEDAFDSVLNDFTKKKYGVPMEEQTKQFLKNELVYLMLMLKEKRGGT